MFRSPSTNADTFIGLSSLLITTNADSIIFPGTYSNSSFAGLKRNALEKDISNTKINLSYELNESGTKIYCNETPPCYFNADADNSSFHFQILWVNIY